MAIAQPQSTDPLGSPDHAALHRVIAASTVANVQSVAVHDDSTVRLPNNLVLSNVAANGIQVDVVTPVFGWRDIIGAIRPDPTGANAPTLTTYRGSIRDYQYNAGDKIDMIFHIPHDYVPNTDIYLHVHWSHIVTSISGSFVINYSASYGAREGLFGTPVTPTQTILTPDIATIPQYSHRVDEIQISSSTPSATLLDTADISIDGVILVNMTATTLPAGVSPFIHTLDLHYQSTNMATRNKAADFYS